MTDADRDMAIAHAGYMRCGQAMLEAARKWKADNPDVPLRFNPLGFPDNTGVIAALDRGMIRRLGATRPTREFLRMLDKAGDHQGTLAQAEIVLHVVFGFVKNCLSGTSDRVQQPKPKPPRAVETFQVPGSVCPDCGLSLDAATETLSDGRKPGPGDFSVCLECTAVLRYGDDMILRPATVAERNELPPGSLEKAVTVATMAKLSLKGRT